MDEADKLEEVMVITSRAVERTCAVQSYRYRHRQDHTENTRTLRDSDEKRGYVISCVRIGQGED